MSCRESFKKNYFDGGELTGKKEFWIELVMLTELE